MKKYQDFMLNSIPPSQWPQIMSMLFQDEKYNRMSENRHTLFSKLRSVPANKREGVMRSVTVIDSQLRDYVWDFISSRAASVSPLQLKSFDSICKEVSSSAEKEQITKDIHRKLDTIVFLLDIIESVVGNINAKLRILSPDQMLRVEMFEGLTSMSEQIRTMLGVTRDECNIRTQTIFSYYAESIEKYMLGRMNSYLRTEIIKSGRTKGVPQDLLDLINLAETEKGNDSYGRRMAERDAIIEKLSDMCSKYHSDIKEVCEQLGVGSVTTEKICADVDAAFQDFIKMENTNRLVDMLSSIATRYKELRKHEIRRLRIGNYLQKAAEQFIAAEKELHDYYVKYETA